jgi:hypothetical protein
MATHRVLPYDFRRFFDVTAKLALNWRETGDTCRTGAELEKMSNKKFFLENRLAFLFWQNHMSQT